MTAQERGQLARELAGAHWTWLERILLRVLLGVKVRPNR